jgi:hypothetical protein
MWAPAIADTSSLFDFLHGLNGKTYPGRMTFPANSTDEMNKPMQITVQVVSDNEIRIPLQVGEDRSRTWVLTRSEAGVLLKHDHRHADGTPDKTTNYGGLAAKVELGTLLIFPADEETRTMLPEASSNAWSLRISPDGSKLYYYLERHAKPRFEAAFDLIAQP